MLGDIFLIDEIYIFKLLFIFLLLCYNLIYLIKLYLHFICNVYTRHMKLLRMLIIEP